MNECGGAELRDPTNQGAAKAVISKRAVQEAGHQGIVGEGLRKRCCHVCTEVVRCKPIKTGLK